MFKPKITNHQLPFHFMFADQKFTINTKFKEKELNKTSNMSYSRNRLIILHQYKEEEEEERKRYGRPSSNLLNLSSR